MQKFLETEKQREHDHGRSVIQIGERHCFLHQRCTGTTDNVAPLLEWVCNLGKNLIPFSLMGSLLTLENQAFSTFSRSLGSEAYSLLCQVPHLFTPAGTIIPFDVTLRALSQLGAKDVALTAIGWKPVSNSSGTSPTEEHREELVLRLLNFVSVYAGYVLLFLS